MSNPASPAMQAYYKAARARRHDMSASPPEGRSERNHGSEEDGCDSVSPRTLSRFWNQYSSSQRTDTPELPPQTEVGVVKADGSPVEVKPPERGAIEPREVTRTIIATHTQ